MKFKRKQAKERLNMGLDMYAYIASKANEKFDNWQEIAYWRKHPNLHGWMEQLWLRKNGYALTDDQQFIEGKEAPSFNGVELELTWEDIDNLEKDIKSGKVARMNTAGFFFGKPSDNYYYDTDLQFCVDAKSELFLKRKVFYNSNW